MIPKIKNHLQVVGLIGLKSGVCASLMWGFFQRWIKIIEYILSPKQRLQRLDLMEHEVRFKGWWKQRSSLVSVVMLRQKHLIIGLSALCRIFKACIPSHLYICTSCILVLYPNRISNPREFKRSRERGLSPFGGDPNLIPN